MNLFFWVLLNLGVPVAGPILTMVFVAPAYGWRVTRELIVASVKDGQLFWSAIALCAAGTYEAITALENGSGEASTLAFGIAGFCGLAFACSIVVTACLLSVRHNGPPAIAADGQTEFAVGTFSSVAIGISIFMSCFVAFVFASLHIHLN